MPTLYTSLLARHRPMTRRTFAPKEQRAPIARKHETLSTKAWQDYVAALHEVYSPEIVRLEPSTKSVGVIGAGLAGLSAAYELRKRGYAVTVFEASKRPG